MPIVMDLFLYALFAVFLAYRMKKARKGYDIAYTVVFLTFAAVLAAYEGASIPVMLLGIALFEDFALSFGSAFEYLFFIFSIAYVYAFVATAAFVAQAVLLGLLAHVRPSAKPISGKSPKTELRRDIMQVSAGAVIVLAFFFLSGTLAKTLVILLVLIGYLIGSYSVSVKKGRVSRFFLSLERKGSEFGQGAKWLAIGALVPIAFLSANNAVPVIVAVFIGDALATIVGLRYRVRLSYNREKSAAGTLVYFVSSAAISFFFVGIAAIPIAAIAAIIESLPKHIDDNVDTSVVLTLIIGLARWIG